MVVRRTARPRAETQIGRGRELIICNGATSSIGTVIKVECCERAGTVLSWHDAHSNSVPLCIVKQRNGFAALPVSARSEIFPHRRSVEKDANSVISAICPLVKTYRHTLRKSVFTNTAVQRVTTDVHALAICA